MLCVYITYILYLQYITVSKFFKVFQCKKKQKSGVIPPRYALKIVKLFPLPCCPLRGFLDRVYRLRRRAVLFYNPLPVFALCGACNRPDGNG